MVSTRLSPDAVWTNGIVETMETHQANAEAFAVRDGKFIAVGSNAEIVNLIGPETKHHDLHGRYVMPGLVESHVHALWGGCRDLLDVYVGYQASFEELLNAVKERAEKLPPGGLIFGGPWRIDMRADMGPCPRKMLDKIAPDQIVILADMSQHCLLANTRTLELAGIIKDCAEIPGGVIERDDTGAPTGILAEMACAPVRYLAKRSKEDLTAAADYFISYFNRLGYTAFKEPMAFEDELATYCDADKRGALTLHAAAHIVRFSPEGAKPISYDEMERLRREYASENVRTGFAKVFLDGVPVVLTGSFIAPYLEAEGYDASAHDPAATLLMPQEELNETITELDRRGFVTKIHAVGDNAVRVGLNAIEAARQRNGNSNLRHEIAHCTFVDTAEYKRFSELNAVAEQSPKLWFPGAGTQSQIGILGKERVDSSYPIKSLLKEGASLTAATDWPAAAPDANPWTGLAGMISRRNPRGEYPGAVGEDQAISLREALPIYTVNGARSLGMEEETGSICANKWADFIVLDRSLHELVPEEIGAIEVQQTYWKGTQVWS
ncbi:MAG: amidohydrolase [Rhodospirillales bacterium]